MSPDLGYTALDLQRSTQNRKPTLMRQSCTCLESVAAESRIARNLKSKLSATETSNPYSSRVASQDVAPSCFKMKTHAHALVTHLSPKRADIWHAFFFSMEYETATEAGIFGIDDQTWHHNMSMSLFLSKTMKFSRDSRYWWPPCTHNAGEDKLQRARTEMFSASQSCMEPEIP